MSTITINLKLGPASILAAALAAAVFSTSAAVADVDIDGEVCNRTATPVSVEYFHHNDILLTTYFTEDTVLPCSCIKKNTNTDLWENPPVLKIKQLAFKETKGTTNTTREICFEGTNETETGAGAGSKKMKGYVTYDATKTDKVKACASRSESVEWSETAPNIDEAKSDYRVLADRLTAYSSKCVSSKDIKDIFGNKTGTQCTKYEVQWVYDDGTNCYGY